MCKIQSNLKDPLSSGDLWRWRCLITSEILLISVHLQCILHAYLLQWLRNGAFKLATACTVHEESEHLISISSLMHWDHLLFTLDSLLLLIAAASSAAVPCGLPFPGTEHCCPSAFCFNEWTLTEQKKPHATFLSGFIAFLKFLNVLSVNEWEDGLIMQSQRLWICFIVFM